VFRLPRLTSPFLRVLLYRFSVVVRLRGVNVHNRLRFKLGGNRRASGAVTQLAATTNSTHYFFLAFPAFANAIATACFWGLPAFISVLIFAETVLLDLPGFRGIVNCTSEVPKKLRRRSCTRRSEVYNKVWVP